MRELLSKNPGIDFLSKGKFAIGLSLLILAWGVLLWVRLGPAKFGIDYAGGSEFVVQIADRPGSERIREALATKKLDNFIVQSFETGSNQYSLRVRESGDSKALRVAVEGALTDAFGAGKVQVLKTDVVGPTIGKELQRQAFIAIGIALVGILLYITFRFEMSYAIGAVLATFHDVAMGMVFYLWAGHEINTATLASALTIMGYSVNDTIVIYDRVREEMRKHKNADMRTVMNESMNLMLSRTIITGTLTLFSAFALWLWGGGGIEDLSLFMVVGCITGMYSTIFIAAPITIAWERFRESRASRRAHATA